MQDQDTTAYVDRIIKRNILNAQDAAKKDTNVDVDPNAFQKAYDMYFKGEAPDLTGISPELAVQMRLAQAQQEQGRALRDVSRGMNADMAGVTSKLGNVPAVRGIADTGWNAASGVSKDIQQKNMLMDQRHEDLKRRVQAINDEVNRSKDAAKRELWIGLLKTVGAAAATVLFAPLAGLLAPTIGAGVGALTGAAADAATKR